MAFGTGGPVDDATPFSVANANKWFVISGEGGDLAGLDKTLHVIAKCTATGSGFTVDHVYQTSADGNSWLDVSGVAHTHTNSSDGGALIDIFRSNSKFNDLNLCRTTDLVKASWNQTVTDTGSIEDATDGTTGERSIRLRPNATSGSEAQIAYPCLKLDFSARSFFQCKLRIETASSLAFHSGVNCDDITAADSNTIKYNVEICTATNNNFFLRTASGSNKSASDSGTAFSTNRVAIRIEHYPDLGTPKADLYIDSGSVFTKTSDIPITGASAANNLIKHTIKNSTGADRPMHVYPSRLVYTVSDNWV